jgi:beta-lactam-binding protein with PASTA domain
LVIVAAHPGRPVSLMKSVELTARSEEGDVCEKKPPKITCVPSGQKVVAVPSVPGATETVGVPPLPPT